jgi:hypothetical protein
MGNDVAVRVDGKVDDVPEVVLGTHRVHDLIATDLGSRPDWCKNIL